MKDNLILSDQGLCAAEVQEFKKAGGKTIVDVSCVGTGRSPAAIRGIANLTGVNVVMSCGFYLHGGLPATIIDETEANLVKTVVDEIRDGIHDTGIRPGIIGEIGVRPNIEEWERKSLRVAAVAHRETGLPISIHVQAVPTIPGFTGEPNGLEVLDLLEKHGVPPDKVIISHTEAMIQMNYMKAIVKRGAYAEMDHFGKEFYLDPAGFRMASDMERVDALAELLASGFGNRVLISQDICFKTELLEYGGWGYAHILNNIVPLMLKRGINRQSIHTVMVSNPAEVLDVDSRYS
jgi:phosphotriesterase-related protein